MTDSRDAYFLQYNRRPGFIDCLIIHSDETFIFLQNTLKFKNRLLNIVRYMLILVKQECLKINKTLYHATQIGETSYGCQAISASTSTLTCKHLTP